MLCPVDDGFKTRTIDDARIEHMTRRAYPTILGERSAVNLDALIE